MRVLSIFITLLGVLSCSGNDPDGKLKVKIAKGTLIDPSGSERGFAGKGTDEGRNEPGSLPYVPVFKGGIDPGWAVLFTPETQTTWLDLEVGSYGGSDVSSNALGLGCLGDFRGVPYGEFEACTQVEAISVVSSSLRVDANDGSTLEGSFTAAFADGSSLSGDIEIEGLQPPVGRDDGPGGGPGTCDTFSDTSPHYGDVQIDAHCWAAGSYEACGNEEGRAASCATLRGMVDCCYTGSGGSCPYC